MKKSIIFEVKNGCYDPEFINEQIFTQCIDIYPEIDTLPYEDYKVLRNAIKELDANSYYMNDGRKITKPIKKILSKYIDRFKLDSEYPLLCNKIASLYSPSYKLKAYFGNKKNLGNGIYEGYKTCFSNGGCNEISRHFLEMYPRTFVLCLEKIDPDNSDNIGKGRCIVYFYGGRTIYLTNFYYNGIKQNYRLFVQALREMLNLKKIHFKTISEMDTPLPIYLNGDSVLITDSKSFNYPYNRIMTCPNCKSKFKEVNLHHYVSSNTHYIGCSENCLNEDNYNCDYCGRTINEDNLYTFNDITLCENCYNDNYRYCDNCGHESLDADYFNFLNGNCYCNDCAKICNDCGKTVKIDDCIEIDNLYYCIDCVDRCNDCDDWHRVEDITLIDDIPYCKDCFDYCHNCDSPISNNDLIEDKGFYYCENCLNEIEDIKSGIKEKMNKLYLPDFLKPKNKVKCPDTLNLFNN